MGVHTPTASPLLTSKVFTDGIGVNLRYSPDSINGGPGGESHARQPWSKGGGDQLRKERGGKKTGNKLEAFAFRAARGKNLRKKRTDILTCRLQERGKGKSLKRTLRRPYKGGEKTGT